MTDDNTRPPADGAPAGGPARIGKYLIRGRLGEGAMGVVYRAFDPHIQREVAIKVLRRQFEDIVGETAPEDSITARFRNEARAVGRIAHPGVVTIHDFGEITEATSASPNAGTGTGAGAGASAGALAGAGSFAFLVMELVDGRGLDQMLKIARPPLTWSLNVMDQLLDALGCAHDRGVWHRDIKPGNLLITRDNRVKLTDFGIARIADRHLTQVASQIGTPGYMAPEQYLGGPIDHRADLFACGVLLYRLTTGRTPFSGAPEAVMYQTLHQEPAAPSALRPGELPPALDAVVRRAMARDPRHRFADAAAMRVALAEIAAGGGLAPNTGGGFDDRTLVQPRHGSGATPTGASTAGSGASRALDAALIFQVERALASHIGPLARHLVSRDLAHSANVEELSRSLARHIADAPEREQFIATAAALAAAAVKTP
ncbi:serine/threonine-protein kinase [Mitsuaria sp. 7]|uniref:serine/threonine-protein kinase n=1 Tax=Mitsuaria sp. 7 TaxID=1658665 RepID=UPI00082D2F35|nr:serine/threonine-protein kinase [Mitsuaria sp. 7]